MSRLFAVREVGVRDGLGGQSPRLDCFSRRWTFATHLVSSLVELGVLELVGVYAKDLADVDV